MLSLATSWQLSWWEWHGLMVVGFLAIGGAAWREWNEERFSALYLDETLRGHKEVTVLFADLAGFTPFTEAHGSAEVHSMLVTYFGRLAPMIRDEFDGEVAEFVGDQIFAVFNKAGDQPDHAVRAARAGLALQRAAAEIRDAGHPDWPHFRSASTPARCSRVSSATAGTGSTASSATRSTSVAARRQVAGRRRDDRRRDVRAAARGQSPSGSPTSRSRARPTRSRPTS